MRRFESQAYWLVAPAALVVALIYSQVGWRKDRAMYSDLEKRYEEIRLERTFPSDGQEIGTSGLRVMRGKDTIPLAELVRGKKMVVYFERRDCAACNWFASRMDSILPTWRDSILVVRTLGKARLASGELMLDSASTAIITGVPAMLVIDSVGFVRHSVPAGLPAVTRVLEFLGMPSPDAIIRKETAARGLLGGNSPPPPADTSVQTRKPGDADS